MAIRTYYQILGVSRDASVEEIAAAKNALAKVYHPDVNVHNGIDTTAYMQEILEAYRTLSNPSKRARYDKALGGGANRVFRTFTVGETDEEEETSFVAYWVIAGKLNEIVSKSNELCQHRNKKVGLFQRLLQRLGFQSYTEKTFDKEMNALALQALTQINALKNAEIPMDYWNPTAMNWILVHWSQNRQLSYHTLCSQFDAFINQQKSNKQRLKLHAQNRRFHHQLKKLLTFAL